MNRGPSIGPRGNYMYMYNHAISIPLTVGHEELGDEVDIPVSATPHALWGLVSLAEVLV